MGMKFYKKWLSDENRYQYEERNSKSTDVDMEEITQEEYEAETSKQWNEYLATLPTEEVSTEPTYDELLEENAALEAENAALLYQVLTGEEFENV